MNLMVPELMGILARALRLIGPVFLLGALAASCNTSKYLPTNQELLSSQRVKLEDPERVTNRADVAYELSTLAQQQPNGNFFGIWPREYFYLDNNKAKDTTRIDRFLRNTIGQRPVVYSDSLSRRSAREMAEFLQYQGYFRARVYHEADRGKQRKVNLIYHVIAGPRFIIDSLVYSCPDPQIDSILQATLPEAALSTGEPLDLNKFDEEKTRISQELRNAGYAFFSGSYFDKLEVDTSRRAGYADVYLSILPPQRDEAYLRYRVGSITVLTDFSALENDYSKFKSDTVLAGVRFLSNQAEFQMRPDVLRRNIFLRPGEYHSREELEKTNLALNGLGNYRFVRINQRADSLQPYTLNYQIQLSPSDRMSLGVDLDLNYTNRNGAVGAGNLLGLGVSPSFRNRNLLGGAELLVTTLRAGVEVNPRVGSNNSAFFNTIDLGVDVSLNLPRFKDFGVYRLLNKVPAPWRGNLLNSRFLDLLKERASTRYSVGYEYLLIQNFYAYTIFNARLGYDLRRSTTSSYRINHLAIDLLDPRTEPQFDTILQQNQFLRRSFGEQFFFSLLFRNIEYNRTGRPDRRGRSFSFIGSAEVAGAEVQALNHLANAVSGNDNTWTPRSGATYAKYLLGLTEVRYYKQYTPQSSFATRFVIGAGRPFGGAEAVPYVKQFFVGGANSMRAWAPRGLGPGGYVDPLSLDTDNNLRLFQTGDLRMEWNVEYRFPLFSFVRGALFADVGNVWTFDEDKERPGAWFRFSPTETESGYVNEAFYRQLAVGMGTGLRVDLSYFIFRLDASVPMRYNYPNDGFGAALPQDESPFSERDYWRSFSQFRLRDITFQLGLGYPF